MEHFHVPRSGVSSTRNDLTSVCVSQPFQSFKAKFNVTFPTECEVLLTCSFPVQIPLLKLLLMSPVR